MSDQAAAPPGRPRVPLWAEGPISAVFALVVSILGGAAIILMVGENPLSVYGTLLRGALGTPERIAGSLLQATPIITCGVAACLALRGGLFNIGVEGQLYVGAFAATWVGFTFQMPAGLHAVVGLVAGMAAGAAWIAIPAIMRARYNANEVVSTILMNYVAVLLTSYLTIAVFKRPGGWSETAPVAETAELVRLIEGSRVSVGLIIALVAALALHLFLTRTGPGYSVSAMGSNPKFAEYGGVRVRRNVVLVLLGSGAIGGLAGGVEALGVHHRFMEGFAPGFGFDGVIAALLANGHPLGVVVVALFFGALRAGSLLMEVETSASREVITVIQAFIILVVSAQFLFRRRGGVSGERRWRF